MSLLDPVERARIGVRQQTELLGAPAPEPGTLYEASWRDYVFAEAWMQPGLDQRARRWGTLVGVADSSSIIPIRTHTYAAMASANATMKEMQEFVLQ